MENISSAPPRKSRKWYKSTPFIIGCSLLIIAAIVVTIVIAIPTHIKTKTKTEEKTNTTTVDVKVPDEKGGETTQHLAVKYSGLPTKLTIWTSLSRSRKGTLSTKDHLDDATTKQIKSVQDLKEWIVYDSAVVLKGNEKDKLTEVVMSNINVSVETGNGFYTELEDSEPVGPLVEYRVTLNNADDFDTWFVANNQHGPDIFTARQTKARIKRDKPFQPSLTIDEQKLKAPYLQMVNLWVTVCTKSQTETKIPNYGLFVAKTVGELKDILSRTSLWAFESDGEWKHPSSQEIEISTKQTSEMHGSVPLSDDIFILSGMRLRVLLNVPNMCTPEHSQGIWAVGNRELILNMLPSEQISNKDRLHWPKLKTG